MSIGHVLSTDIHYLYTYSQSVCPYLIWRKVYIVSMTTCLTKTSIIIVEKIFYSTVTNVHLHKFKVNYPHSNG